MFPYNVSEQEIRQYVKDVERIIKPLNPHIIYLYQTDIGAALQKICTRRGGDTESNFVHAATQSPYGRSRGLEGFEGMVAYWESYRRITDEAFEDLDCSKIAIDNTEANWPLYYRQIVEFLGMDYADDGAGVQYDFQHLAGTYSSERDGIADCSIQIESGTLIADGLPQVWTRSVLIPLSATVFQVQSLPFQVKFVEGDHLMRMMLTGPALLSGPVDYTFIKTEK